MAETINKSEQVAFEYESDGTNFKGFEKDDFGNNHFLSSKDLSDIEKTKELIEQSKIIGFEFEYDGLMVLKGFTKELDNPNLKEKFREGNGAITVNT